jgi:hypothetical protein
MSIRDCAFDSTSFNTGSDFLYGNATYNDYDYNAYTNSANPFSAGGTYDVQNVKFEWQLGSGGPFYLSTNSPLINKGSQTADLATLYHFTTQTNDFREADTIVDIGYHYVAGECSGIDVLWSDDTIPAGATQAADGGDSWSWILTSPTPFSGALAHKSNLYAGEHQHYFLNTTDTLPINSGDTLIAYVYLDPTNTPSEIMLQWRVASWEHRAYWGANSISFGVNGTDSRRYMGALPAAGKWVRLEVPANLVGVSGYSLTGMAFVLYGGQATWDYAGKSGGMLCYDTDEDGTPDYLEDTNGNGLIDSGETDWQSATDQGFQIRITRPANDSILP